MIISRTPLRISLFGGGTDFKGYYEKHEGSVISTTIDKYIYVIVKPNHLDNRIVLNYFDREQVHHVDEIKHDIFREALKLAQITQGVEITSLTDIPLQGTGLGTSSAFTVGLLNALFSYQGKSFSPEQLAEMACHIEIDILGAPIGKQDQYAAAFGGLREYKFGKDGQVETKRIEIDSKSLKKLASQLLLFHTGIERKASIILGDQKNRIERNIEHLHDLKDVVQRNRKHLEDLNIEKIGEALSISWESKKKLSKNIQNEVIERMYELGMKSGAYGGKLLGAGGGGFFLFICPPNHQPNLREALTGFKELPFFLDGTGTHTSFLQEPEEQILFQNQTRVEVCHI